MPRTDARPPGGALARIPGCLTSDGGSVLLEKDAPMSQDLRPVLAERCWVGKKGDFFLSGLMFSHWGRAHFLNDVPTSRDSFEACTEPILDFLDTNSDATDVLDTNLALLFQHLAE